MTLAIAIVLGILGVGVMLFGIGMYIAFRVGLAVFERSLKTVAADSAKEEVRAAAMKIGNPMVRRVVLNHLVETGGTVAVAMVRSLITSRMRTGMYLAIGGIAALIAAFHVNSWLPMIWKAG